MNSFVRRVNGKLASSANRAGWTSGRLLPVHVTIEPTNACNSKCLMCLPYRRDPSEPHPESGMLTRETLERTGPALRLARRVLLSGFGEPLMHPDFVEIVRWAKARAPWTYMFTNGALLTPEIAEGLIDAGMDQVCFSVGGACEATQQHVRGIGLDPLRQGIANLADAKRRAGHGPELVFNIVAMKSVLAEFDGIVEMAREYRVSRIDLPQMWVESPAALVESPLLEPGVGERFERLRSEAAAKGVTVTVWDYPPSPSPCRSPFNSIWVAWNGDVYSCQYERYVMGNVRETDVLALWRGAGFRELRRRVIADAGAVCPNCPAVLGTVDAFLDPAVHGRFVAPRFTAQGPERVVRERVRDGERAAEM